MDKVSDWGGESATVPSLVSIHAIGCKTHHFSGLAKFMLKNSQRFDTPGGAEESEAIALLPNDIATAYRPHQGPQSSFPPTSSGAFQEEDLFDPWKQHCQIQYEADDPWNDEEDDTHDDNVANTNATTKVAAAVLAIGSVGFMATRALMQDDDVDDGTGANILQNDGGTGVTAQPHSMHVNATTNQATQGGLPQPPPDGTNAAQMASAPPSPALSPAELQMVQQMATQAASNAASAAGSAASAVAGTGVAAIGSVAA